MTRLRFTLAQLMAIVLYVGFGFAALRNADEIWASTAFTLAVLMMSVAPLGALARKGRARMAWAGFAVFGWSRFLVGALPLTTSSVFGPISSPGLLSEQGFTHVLPYLFTPAGGFSSDHTQVFLSLDIILFGLVGALVGRIMAGKDERPNS
jgi:hypothetical protein